MHNYNEEDEGTGNENQKRDIFYECDDV